MLLHLEKATSVYQNRQYSKMLNFTKDFNGQNTSKDQSQWSHDHGDVTWNIPLWTNPQEETSEIVLNPRIAGGLRIKVLFVICFLFLATKQALNLKTQLLRSHISFASELPGNYEVKPWQKLLYRWTITTLVLPNLQSTIIKQLVPTIFHSNSETIVKSSWINKIWSYLVHSKFFKSPYQSVQICCSDYNECHQKKKETENWTCNNKFPCCTWKEHIIQS